LGIVGTVRTHDEERGSPSPGAPALHGPPKVVGDAGESGGVGVVLLLLVGLGRREGMEEGIGEDGGVHGHPHR